MIKTLKVRNLVIGEGKPKVIVPIVGKTETAILAKADEIDYDTIDAIEWRVDFYDDVFNIDKVKMTAEKLRAKIGEKPLIFTFRTGNEGGEKAISMSEYIALNTAIAKSGFVDIIDVEIFSGDEIVRTIIDNVHDAGKFVIASNHDFQKTPPESELISRMQKMQDMGADLPKIAMMPTSKEDVLTLLSATLKMHTLYADRPIITMSMSGKGVISRLSGEVFGSAMTFGAVGQVSAPGQIPVENLNSVLEIISKSM